MGWFRRKTEPTPVGPNPHAVPDPRTQAGMAPYIRADSPTWANEQVVRRGPTLRLGAGTIVAPSQNKSRTDVDRARTMYASQIPTTPLTPLSGRWAPNPLSHTRPPARIQWSETEFRETNPFDWQYAHRGDGRHMSMATLIRAYPVGGMQPMMVRRNTYRLEPPPHDIRQTDLPAEGTTFDVDQMSVAGVSPYSLRSFRSILR